MTFDTLIRNGTIVDGSGDERYVGDIAIRDRRIAAIGDISPGDAEEVIDAGDLVVAPGFIDCHTHYDAQLFWDPLASPSPFHGVTTVIGGLCGFSIQPMNRDAADYLIPMLSQVEDIPISALEAGVPLDWKGFGEFRARLEGRTAINAGFATGHSALRRVVMGERANSEKASPQELRAMQALLRDALEQGSLGLSTSNSVTHNDHFGEPVPSRHADHDEFVAMAGVCRDYEGSQLEIQPGIDFNEDTYRLLADMSLAAERTINWNALFTLSRDAAALADMDRQLKMSDYAREKGGRVVGLTVPVTGGAHIDLARGGVFDMIPGWTRLFKLAPPERIAALRDPSFRAYLKEQALSPQGQEVSVARGIAVQDRLLIERGATEATRRLVGMSLMEVAKAQGTTQLDALFDLGVADELQTLFTFRAASEDIDTYRFRVNLWRDERVCVGGSDAGAHVETIDTFNYFTRMLATPVRKYGVLSLEECVHHITQAPAQLMGLKDRGELRAGAWADICIFDPATVGSRPTELRPDFPGGASRLYAEADGIERVVVGGQTVIDRGRFTGAIAGQFLERGRDTRTVGLAA